MKKLVFILSSVVISTTVFAADLSANTEVSVSSDVVMDCTYQSKKNLAHNGPLSAGTHGITGGEYAGQTSNSDAQNQILKGVQLFPGKAIKVIPSNTRSSLIKVQLKSGAKASCADFIEVVEKEKISYLALGDEGMENISVTRYGLAKLVSSPKADGTIEPKLFCVYNAPQSSEYAYASAIPIQEIRCAIK